MNGTQACHSNSSGFESADSNLEQNQISVVVRGPARIVAEVARAVTSLGQLLQEPLSVNLTVREAPPGSKTPPPGGIDTDGVQIEVEV